MMINFGLIGATELTFLKVIKRSMLVKFSQCSLAGKQRKHFEIQHRLWLLDSIKKSQNKLALQQLTKITLNPYIQYLKSYYVCIIRGWFLQVINLNQ